MGHYATLGAFALLGTLFAGIALIASSLLAPKSAEGGKKREPYESGEDPVGPAHFRFKVGYYLFALVFLIFDLEAIFLFPALLISKDVREGALANTTLGIWWLEVMVFMGVLALGLGWAWRRKALEWD